MSDSAERQVSETPEYTYEIWREPYRWWVRLIFPFGTWYAWLRTWRWKMLDFESRVLVVGTARTRQKAIDRSCQMIQQKKKQDAKKQAFKDKREATRERFNATDCP